MSKGTYYALTTQNAQLLGWRCVGVGETKADALAEAPTYTGIDLVSDTLRKNLVVVSRSAAIRRGWINKEQWPIWNEERASYRWEK